MLHGKSARSLVLVLALAAAGAAACGEDAAAVDGGGIPVADARQRPDARPRPDASVPDAALGLTGAACTSDTDCAGGTCLGLPGGPGETDKRFVGGYCTSTTCTLSSSAGCDIGAWCTTGGPTGTLCVKTCAMADGISCDRADHACLRLGPTRGACYNIASVECDAAAMTGCVTGDICIRTGFDDATLGRCEIPCSPMAQDCDDTGVGCYYSRLYDVAFCALQGAGAAEDLCTCDRCCGIGLACTPDLDGADRHCKATCDTAAGCAGGTCQPLEAGALWGGCVLPGSVGSM